MSLQTRLAALAAAIGADVKELKAAKSSLRIRSVENVGWASTTIPQLTSPFSFGAGPAISQTGTDLTWNTSQWRIDIGRSGLYLVGFELMFATVAAEQVRDCILARNSDNVRLCEDRVSVAANTVPVLKGADVIACAAGDYLRLFPAQNSGASVNIIPSASNASRMFATYLGPSA